jgi:hypothetical protein
MTTTTPILTGVAAHIGSYADAVAVSGGGTRIFVSGTPGYGKTAPRLRTSPTKRGSAGRMSRTRSARPAPSSLTLSTCANGSPAVTMCRPTSR